jgi:hypothetical protein
MCSTNLAASIDTVLSALAQSHPGWWDTANLWSVIDPEYIGPVTASLKVDPITGGLEGIHVTDGMGFGGGLDLNRLAQWMIYRSREVGAAETINNVREFATSNEPEMLTVCALNGVVLENPVQLQPDLLLMPITQLPPCQQRNEALGLIPRVSLQMQPLRRWPSAALVLKYKIHPAISRSDQPSKQAADDRAVRDTRLAEARLCMAVACKGVIDLIATWSQPAAAKIPAVFPTGAMSTVGGGFSRRPPKVFDSARVQRIINLFTEFRGERASLHVPLERLNSAMVQTRVVDRAIDLGIALEALLMHEPSTGQRSDNQELRFKIGLRGAWLGGGTPEKRQACAVTLRKLYDLRSAAVHSGRITRGDTMEHHHFLESGEDLCADLITKVLETGCWPDWDKLVVGR